MKRIIPVTMLLLLTQSASAQRMSDDDNHSKYIKKVVEFKPAPGQFVNVHPQYVAGDTYQTMLDKCTERLADNQGTLVSLGGFGGYITFTFDHSIANIKGQPDVVVQGNAFVDNSEPGIVMVSKDANGNGLPDDPWYELKGSADEDGAALHGYTITYRRPLTETYDTERSSISKDITIEKYIPWTDNQGGSGYMHKNRYHTQVYYPLWVDGDELTFTGTLLPKNAVNTATLPAEDWKLHVFAWGYADNQPYTDEAANSFDFDHAVDSNRQPVSIDFVDFIRVYNAENQDCGWIGETSTEVLNAYDLHLEESIAAIKASAGISGICAEQVRVVGYYTLDGRQPTATPSGLMLVRMSDGTVRKTFIK